MKKLLLISGILIGMFSNAQTPTYQWAKLTGTPDLKPTSTVVDSSGNVYSIGQFEGTIDFDPSTAVFNLTAGGKDGYVTKFDSSGNFVWAFKIGGFLDDYAKSINLDSTGNLIIGGNYKYTADFDPSAATFNLTSGFGFVYNSFILKITPSMEFVWVKHFTNWENQLMGLQIDASDNIIATGKFGSTVDFDPNAGTTNMVAPSNTDRAFYLVKLTSTGDLIWAKKYADEVGVGSEIIYDFKMDTQGNIYTIGSVNGSADFDPNTTNTLVNIANYSEVFVQKLDANANLIFVKKFGTQSVSRIIPKDLLIDSNGNIFIGGGWQFPTDFDPGTGTFILDPAVNTLANGNFILKLSNTGDFVWVKTPLSQVITNGNQLPGTTIYGGITMKNDEIYQTGRVKSGVYFGSIFVLTNAIVGDFDNNVYIAKLDNNGDYQWAINLQGSVSNNYTSDPEIIFREQLINVDSNNNIYIQGGVLNGDLIDFDPSNLTSEIGGFGNFLAKYNQQGLATNQNIFANPEIKIYPNPTTGNFNIAIDENLVGAKVSVYNVLGQKVKKFSLDGLNTNQNLDKGIYILEIEKDGNKTSKKLIVN